MNNRITIPNNNVAEREYILKYIFTEIIGVDFTLVVTDNVEDYIIDLEHSKRLVVKDHFFSKNVEDLTYLKVNNIPNEVSNFHDETIKKIPVIYGNPEIKYTENEIVCEIDVFSSSFFMLSRWEENVLTTNRDKYERFDEEESLSVKFGFFDIPVVNRYIELLWKLIQNTGFNQPRKYKEYEVVITHDVDFFYRYDSIKKIVKAFGGDILIRKNPFLLIQTLLDGLKSLINIKYDPYNNFDYLMSCSEAIGVKSRFYFIPSRVNETDARYDILNNAVIEVMNDIIGKGHKVGVHCSWNSYNDRKIFEEELSRFQLIDVEEGRQHYLRFSNPLTWRLWDDCGLKKDSTIGFYNRNGFRAGICYEYPVFDVENRKELKLIENPLIFMEGAIGFKLTLQSFKENLVKLSKEVKKYNGNMVFLWHSNNLKVNEWKHLGNHYQEFLTLIR